MSSDEDWSDSDSEPETSQQAGVATSVLLGLPDGPLTSAYDDADPAVSRAGGLPPFLRLRHYPSPDAARCKRCREPMEMLVSVFCPFEGSSKDRVLYVWGCARAACQRKEGSVRAFRSLRHNEKYARKLERQRERAAARAAAASSAPRMKAAPSQNPFVTSTDSSSAVPFASGLGDMLFGTTEPIRTDSSASESAAARSDWSDEDSENEDEDGSGDDEDDGDDGDVLSTYLQDISISRSEPDPAWSSQPSYRPIYVSTVDEYISPKPPPTLSKKALTDAQSDGAGAPWGKETYEVMHKVDDVFERFTSRVQGEPQQVIRYELSGTPLPFASRDSVYARLFPPERVPAGTAVPVSGAPAPAKHTYDPASIAPCPACGGPRVFECQLMPNLISLLQRPPAESAKRQSVAERQKELDALLKGAADGMEWGTVLVFSCLGDCCTDDAGAPADEAWREEVVLVQWDD